MALFAYCYLPWLMVFARNLMRHSVVMVLNFTHLIIDKLGYV